MYTFPTNDIVILLEPGLPTFDTIMFNARRRFTLNLKTVENLFHCCKR